MNKQRKVVITTTYNEMGIIIDTKAEEVAQPERLTDDDFETIRIHLSAIKEKLCNQHRWKEAEEYERLIERFMAFASAQPERKTGHKINQHQYPAKWVCSECGARHFDFSDNFCSQCGAYVRGEQNETD